MDIFSLSCRLKTKMAMFDEGDGYNEMLADVVLERLLKKGAIEHKKMPKS